jgi:hypothetical protein
MSYPKIDLDDPTYRHCKNLRAANVPFCDALNHNATEGCDNPTCFKFKGRCAMPPGPVTPAATGRGLCEQI